LEKAGVLLNKMEFKECAKIETIRTVRIANNTERVQMANRFFTVKSIEQSKASLHIIVCSSQKDRSNNATVHKAFHYVPSRKTLLPFDVEELTRQFTSVRTKKSNFRPSMVPSELGL